MKLYFVLLGCRPPGRKTEQHDVFVGIGGGLSALVQDMVDSWPEAEGKLHIDAWREVRCVDGYEVSLVPASECLERPKKRIWFVNLGGYKPGIFEEFHHKLLVVAEDQAEAIRRAKEHPFFREYHIPGGGASHVDDKWALEVDEVAPIAALLPLKVQKQWRILLHPAVDGVSDVMHIGYTKLSSLKSSQ